MQSPGLTGLLRRRPGFHARVPLRSIKDATARGADAAGSDCVAYLSARNHGVSQPRLRYLAAISNDALAISLLAGQAVMHLSAMMHAINLGIRFTPHECQRPCGSMDRACVSGAALAKLQRPQSAGAE
jgi:hypothetical protein